MIVPPVKELITPVTAERRDEKKDVAVALVIVAEPAERTLTDAEEMLVVARVLCPDTVSAVAEAVASTV